MQNKKLSSFKSLLLATDDEMKQFGTYCILSSGYHSERPLALFRDRRLIFQIYFHWMSHPAMLSRLVFRQLNATQETDDESQIKSYKF